MKTPLIFFAIVPLMICSCAPQREYVAFGDAGTFHPGPRYSSEEFSDADTEYDSYELVDNGRSPNHGIPPMYGGGYSRYGHRSAPPSVPHDAPMYYDGRHGRHGGQGGYPRAVDTYDQHGNRQTMIIPNPW